jgi:hypothetical protein
MLRFRLCLTVKRNFEYDGKMGVDTTSLRGTFLVTPYKPMYVLPVRWSTNPNERPKSGNLDPDYIAPAGVDYILKLNFN